MTLKDIGVGLQLAFYKTKRAISPSMQVVFKLETPYVIVNSSALILEEYGFLNENRDELRLALLNGDNPLGASKLDRYLQRIKDNLPKISHGRAHYEIMLGSPEEVILAQDLRTLDLDLNNLYVLNEELSDIFPSDERMILPDLLETVREPA